MQRQNVPRINKGSLAAEWVNLIALDAETKLIPSCTNTAVSLLDIKALNGNDGVEIQYERVWIGLILQSSCRRFPFGRLLLPKPFRVISPVASVKQLMLDLIHPSSNDILLAIYRGA